MYNLFCTFGTKLLYALTGAFEMRRPFRFEKKRRIFDLCTADTYRIFLRLLGATPRERYVLGVNQRQNAYCYAPRGRLVLGNSAMASRRQSRSEGRTLYFILLVLISVPVFVLVRMVIAGVGRLQWIGDLCDESQPLLNV